MSETVTHSSRRCPRCGRPLPVDAPEGLCASCLLTAGAETMTGTGDVNVTRSIRPEPRLANGQQWGSYRIVRLLGRGGMGEVYEAEQLSTGRQVALKVLRDSLRSAEDRARFLREGQLAASISHPHTVYIFGSEEVDGAPAIVMELLPGGTLKDRVVDEGPMSPTAAVGAILDIIGGLDAAHAAGILHRDIKPSNCFIDREGTVKVGDFGLSISTLARDVRHELGSSGFEGTPQFAAPEQLRGEPLDVRADMYAVGATLFFLLTGRPPIEDGDLRELARRVTEESPPSLRQIRRDVPNGLSQVVRRCLSKTPAERPGSYAELADALRPFGVTDGPAAPLLPRILAGVLDILIISAIVGVWTTLAVTLGVSPIPSAGRLAPSVISALVVQIAYYVVLEGFWRASLGKALLGLRISAPTQGSWPIRIVIRSLLFNIPTIFSSGVQLYWDPSTAFVAQGSTDFDPRAMALWSVALALGQWLLAVALFSTARRRNGWAGVHDLVSRTRVVRAARELRRTADDRTHQVLNPRETPSAATRLIGAFAIRSEIGSTGHGRLFVAFDTALRREVWVHVVPAGTPAVDAGRRDLSRVGRLHWLAGRRSADENWDAFEAPSGRALGERLKARVEWAVVKLWLVDLAQELHDASEDHTLPELTVDCVWIRKDGRPVLLDLAWPPSVETRQTPMVTPVDLLRLVAERSLATKDRDDADRAPLPLSAGRVLDRLSASVPPSIAEALAGLKHVSTLPDQPSRWRRLVPIAWVTLMVVIAPMGALSGLRSFAPMLEADRADIMLWLTWLGETGPDAEFQDAEARAAAEQYVVARYGSVMASTEFWDQPYLQYGTFVEMRRLAETIVARHEPVSAEQVARARLLIARQIAESEESRAERPADPRSAAITVVSVIVTILLCFSLVLSLISSVIVPGGVVTRVLGLALVTSDGHEAGRVRSVARMLMAWSPAILWLAYLWFFGNPTPPTIVPVAVVVTILAVGALWTIARPQRGPHDRLSGTWVVTR